MGKTRVHLLAKELGVETKDLIAQLDRLGLRGRKAQSALEDDEVARVRSALAAQERPQVHVGEEKVVADRMVKTEDETHHSAEARETVVERRVRANVIRRRVNRTEIAPAEAPSPAPEPPHVEASPELEPAVPSIEEIPVEEFPQVEADEGISAAPETPTEEPSVAPETAQPSGAEPIFQPQPEKPQVNGQTQQPATQEAPRGARILGRIDLKQTMRIEPAPTPVRRPPGAVPGQPGARVAEGEKPQAGAGETTATDDKPKAGRHKRRVVKKQDVLELR